MNYDYTDLDLLIMSIIKDVEQGSFDFEPGTPGSRLIEKYYSAYREMVKDAALKSTGGSIPDNDDETISAEELETGEDEDGGEEEEENPTPEKEDKKGDKAKK